MDEGQAAFLVGAGIATGIALLIAVVIFYAVRTRA